MNKLEILPYKRKTTVEVGKRLLDVLVDLHLYVSSVCGGKGVCRKDKVKIIRGGELLNDPTQNEKRLLSKDEPEKGFRLACQAIFVLPGEVVVYVLEGSRCMQDMQASMTLQEMYSRRSQE